MALQKRLRFVNQVDEMDKKNASLPEAKRKPSKRRFFTFMFAN